MNITSITASIYNSSLYNSPQILHGQFVQSQITIFAIQTRSGTIAFGFAGAASVAACAQLYSSIGAVSVGGVTVGGPVGGGGGGIVHLLLA